MLHTTKAPATVLTEQQYNLMTIHPTTTPLPTPRWKPAVLLHYLQTWITSCMRRRPIERQRIRSDFPRRETAADLLARNYTYLYTRSLCG